MSRWARWRQSFWLIPALLCVVAVAGAEALITLDRRLGDVDLGAAGVLVNRVGASGSRDLLGAIAGSMLAVASTTFSITIAALALASSTYGPRLVRNFMADRGNQVVLGVFVATFLYSLLVLRSIRVVDDGAEEPFVPHLAVNVAVLLAVASIGVLVYFIHHISDSIQVATLARQVRADLLSAVERLYPEQVGRGPQPISDEDRDEDRDEDEAGPDVDGLLVASEHVGYVQDIDHDRLLALAVEHDLVVHLQVRPGTHCTQGSPVARVVPAERASLGVLVGVREVVRVARSRTPDQDVEFPVLQLEEMAVRALSPSTNDPYTAINALDDLSAGLVSLAGRRTPSPYRYDSRGHLRVVAPTVVLDDLVDHVLDAMRWYATGHPTVLHRTLDLVHDVGTASSRAAVRVGLAVHVRHLVEAFERSSPQDCDAEGLRRHAEQVHRSLAGQGQQQRPT